MQEKGALGQLRRWGDNKEEEEKKGKEKVKKR